ncbi:MAG: membrane-bound O-acyltransferase family protein [Bacteroidetes bacterium]|nr:MAG: membrane-bound O-acyltransferase family protein [Bacteroidota bacterium]PIE88436.1 MAG: membrane-bound O-acyltransferase family protein [Bacteroidota bacterium]
MLFNTIEFVIFLPVVIIAYFLIPHKFRWILLLAASYFFYMSWKVEYIFLIITSTLIDYFSGIFMERQKERRARLPWLILSLCSNLGLLFFFKYFNFAASNLNLLFAKMGMDTSLPLMKFLLPVGISFYTFQTLSYSIDVYFGRQKAERHLGYFALYVSFFPQLVAGPIERFSRLTPQLKKKHDFSYQNLIYGLRLILFGLFIKMVIADNLAGIVDAIYAAPGQYASSDILKGILFYSFQIYSDFYGYSIIAIGSAKIMGIELMDNFKTPYLAKNIGEFWQRWHISLSTWFRDYLYFPMGGNRVTKLRWALNILTVFVVSGFWHGANWTFLIWGGIFGIIYLTEHILNSRLKLVKPHEAFSLGHLLLSLKTFTFVTLIWVFFRSPSLGEAIHLFELLFQTHREVESSLMIPTYVWIFFIFFVLSDMILYNKRIDSYLSKVPFLVRWGVYAFLIFSIIVFAGVENFPFIYFQF